MAALEKIKTFFEGLDEKTFYKYLAIYLGIVFVLVGLMIFRYYQNINYLDQRINTVNELREDARQVLEKSVRVEQQHKEVNRILEEDPDFKIKGYFDNLIDKLNLPQPTLTRVTKTSRDENYEESSLEIKFTDITMKELAQLLQDIEQNKRIYSKALEINVSKKQPHTIDVNLTIATLHKKIAQT